MSDVTRKLKALSKKSKRRKGPLWKGPDVDGITQSMLSGFLVCRERFRVYVIDGLKPREGFNMPLRYGDMWHKAEEVYANSESIADVNKAILSMAKEWVEENRNDQEAIDKCYRLVKLQFPIYADYWAENDDVKNRKALYEEYAFHVPYTLPSGRVVILRGKWDSVDCTTSKNIILQENKSKGNPDKDAIAKQLRFDLQTMIYCVALREFAKTSKKLRGRKLTAIRYNVIRRPLSGGKYSIRQKQGTKTKPAQTKQEFYDELKGLISNDREFFFFRWDVPIEPIDLTDFENQFLIPNLEALWDWWEWVAVEPNNPFREGNQYHWRTPYGIHNPLINDRSMAIDSYVNDGIISGMERVNTLFPELED